MSHYIRYVLTDERGVTLGELEQALRQVDAAYAIGGDTLVLGEAAYGIIDITPRGDEICDGDLELLEGLAQGKKQRDEILAALRGARSMVTVQPLWLGRDEDAVGEVLQPLWDWLLTNRSGIMAVEGGHFFNRDGALG